MTTWEMNVSSPDRPARTTKPVVTPKHNNIIPREATQAHSLGIDCANSDTTASLSTSTNEDNGNPIRQAQQYSSALLSDAVIGIKEAASDTYKNVRDWANSPNGIVPTNNFFASPKCTDRDDPKHTHYSGNLLDGHSDQIKKQDSRNITSSTGCLAKQQSTRTIPLSPARSLIQDLVSPFLACGVYSDDQLCTQEISKEEMRKKLAMNNIGIFHRSFTDNQTVASLDSQAEEEMLQLHRLTSWGTTGTLGTATTYDTATSASLDSIAPGHSTERPIIGSSVVASRSLSSGVVIQDDDGNIIPAELIEHAQRRREQRRTRRKRVVTFDYPPISALRECPRPNPEDLPKLFFTEEEMDEIEADRSSMNIADDVEIVAIATPSKDDSLSSQEDWNMSKQVNKFGSPEKLSLNVGFGHDVSPSKTVTKKRPQSPHPRKAHEPPNRESALAAKRPPRLATSATSPTSDSSPKVESRLLKGVQIYLRERSTGQGS